MTLIVELGGRLPREAELDVFERGRVATDQMNRIKAELIGDPAFIRARGEQMFDQGGKPRTESFTTFPVLGGYLSVRYKIDERLEEMDITWSDKVDRIAEGNVEGILLRAFDYDHERPNPIGQWGAIIHRKLFSEGESHVNINTQKAVDAVVSFRATYLQRPT